MKRIRTIRLGLLTIALVAMASPGSTQEAADAPPIPPRLSRSVELALGRFQEFIDNKDWSGAALMLSRILAQAPRQSFDAAMTNAVIAQVYLQRGEDGDAEAAIEPLEAALASDYFELQQELDWMYLLAQLHVQSDNRRRAEELMDRWMEENVDPLPEGVIFYATLLVDRAQSQGEQADLAVLEEAMFHIERGMLRIPEPPEMYYYLQAACLQGLERYVETTEVLEGLIARNPERASYWEHLYSLYAADELNLRALLTIERAQEHGLLDSPVDQSNRVSHYYNLGQYDTVIALLDEMLPQDAIANAESMWALLGFACQQTGRMSRAIEAYREVARRFPKARYHLMAANLLFTEERLSEALDELDAALSSEDLGQIVSPSLFAAYIAYELEEYERALVYLERAESKLASERDRQDFESMKIVIERSITEPPPPT